MTDKREIGELLEKNRDVGISRACVAWQANPYQYQRHDPRRYDMLLMDVDANVGIGYRFHAMRELALGGRACCVGFVHILDDCLRLAKRWDDEAIARHEPRFHRSEALKALTLSEADGMSKFNWQVCYSILGMREQYDVARRTLATKKPNTGSDSVDKPLVTDGTVYGMRAKGMRTQQAIIDALKQVTRHDGDADDDAMDCGTEGTNQDGADGSTDICILINTVTNDIADEIAGTVSCSVKTVRRHLDTIRQTNEARQKREAAIGSVRKRQGNGKGVAVTVWEAIRPLAPRTRGEYLSKREADGDRNRGFGTDFIVAYDGKHNFVISFVLMFAYERTSPVLRHVSRKSSDKSALLQNRRKTGVFSTTSRMSKKQFAKPPPVFRTDNRFGKEPSHSKRALKLATKKRQ